MFFRKIDGSREPDDLIANLIQNITNLNKPKDFHKSGNVFLASPYYSVEEIMPYLAGYAKGPLYDFFLGQSYSLKGLIHLYVRRNWKVKMKMLWPKVTRVSFVRFEPEKKWHYCLWRSIRGTNFVEVPQFTKKWEDLKKESFEDKGLTLPNLFKKDPVLFLIFLIVFPHRFSADAVRWIDSKLKNLDVR